jgi:cytochrome P450
VTRIKRIGYIFNKFESLTKHKLSSRKSEMASKDNPADDKPRDLLTRLLEANREEGNLSLDDQELVGNCFIFLFAGHGKNLL